MSPSTPQGSIIWPLFILVLGLLANVASYADSNPVELTVTAPYIDVHTGPGRGYPVTHAIERDEKIDVHKLRTDWFLITTRDRMGAKEGWVHRDSLTGSLYADGTVADFSLPSRDDLSDNRWVLSGMGGDFAGADSLSFSLGYRMTKNLTVDARVGRAVGDFSDSEFAYLRLTSQPFPEWRVTPYFMLGAGAVTTSFNTQLTQIDDRADASMLVGLGVQTYLSRNFVARLEYNQHLVLQTEPNANEDINEWQFGFSVSF